MLFTNVLQPPFSREMHDIQPSGTEELNIYVREFGPFSPEDCLIDNSIIQAAFVCAECIIYQSTVSEGVLVILILRIYLALSICQP